MNRIMCKGFPLLFVAVLAMLGCDADSPTAPQQPQNPVPNNPVPPGATAWNLQVVTFPDDFELTGGELEALVSVTARQVSNGQLAPNGASIILTTTFGGFVTTNAAGAEALQRTVVVNTRGGQASALLRFIGDLAGTAVIQAQLEQSFGQAVLEVREPPPEPIPEPPAPFFIGGLEPNIGEPTGGTTRIFGSGFDQPIRVIFGDLPAPVIGFSPEILTVEIPPIDLPVGTTRIVPVTVTINLNDTDPEAIQQTDTLANAFTYARGGGGGGVVMPRIFGISPTSGPNEGGTNVTINGEGFSAQVQVFFGSTQVSAPVISSTPTRLVVETPAATGSNSANLNQIVDIRVLNIDTGFTSTLPGAFQYGDGQSGEGMFISSAGPTEGPYTGGQIVTIFGSGFAEPVAVEFGGFGQQKVSVTGSEIVARSVRVQLQDCQAQTGPFAVTNINTGSGTVSELEYTYRPVMVSLGGLSPDSVRTDSEGFILPGEPTSVTVSGVGGLAEGDPVTLLFGEALAFNAFYNATSNTITADIPPFSGDFERDTPCTTSGGLEGMELGPARVDVVLTNNQTGCDITLTNRFTYRPDSVCEATSDPPPPLVLSVTPNVGTSAGGDAVTVTGQNFSSPVRVTFGGVPATSPTLSGDTTIMATTPAFLGPFTTAPCDDNMDMTMGTRNQPTQVDVVVTNLSDGMSATLANGFTFTPTDTSCMGD